MNRNQKIVDWLARSEVKYVYLSITLENHQKIIILAESEINVIESCLPLEECIKILKEY